MPANVVGDCNRYPRLCSLAFQLTLYPCCLGMSMMNISLALVIFASPSWSYYYYLSIYLSPEQAYTNAGMYLRPNFMNIFAFFVFLTLFIFSSYFYIPKILHIPDCLIQFDNNLIILHVFDKI